ncbi:MAG: heme-binding protein [Pseudomonadota bacterium]
MRFILFAALLAALPMSAGATEEPPHSVLVEDGKFEIRQYEPTIVAEIEVTGDMQRAGNSGFRPLAGYIFGDNMSRAKIDMTAPVTRVKSEKIEMTSPVTRTQSDKDTWTVAFVMPKEWTIATLPAPNDPSVEIRKVPGELIATIRFSGRPGEVEFSKREAELRAWMSSQGYVDVGPARFAGYNAPFVPGAFRRNEVMIPITLATS